MTAKRPFDGFDFEGFWADLPYSLENYVEPPPSEELIASIEQELGGYRLPAAYVDLALRHNGGLVNRNCHPMKQRTGWSETTWLSPGSTLSGARPNIRSPGNWAPSL